MLRMARRPQRDPYRCERCLVFWAPESAEGNLWNHRGFVVCADRRACNGRIAFTAALDRAIRQPSSGPLEPTHACPVVTLHPTRPAPGDAP